MIVDPKSLALTQGYPLFDSERIRPNQHYGGSFPDWLGFLHYDTRREERFPKFCKRNSHIRVFRDGADDQNLGSTRIARGNAPDVPPMSAALTSAAWIVTTTTPMANVSTGRGVSPPTSTFLNKHVNTSLDIVTYQHLSEIDGKRLRRD